MIKIKFVIPYHEIKEEIYALIKESNEDDIVFEIIENIGTKDIVLSDFDADIVIARGSTYLMLKRSLENAAIIEIQITGYDVIRAINKCKKQFNPSKVAVIGPETMIFGVDCLEEIMHINIESYKVENEKDVISALEKAKEHKVDAIVGGIMAYNIAKNMGWNSIWVQTGTEAIKQSIKEAINTANVVRLERAKSKLLKIILENAREAVIAIDKYGKITAFNKAAYEVLNINENRTVLGDSISEVIPSSKLYNLLKGEYEDTEIIDKVNNTMVVFNVVPINVEDYNAGTVITIQNGDKIQNIETKIRKELNKKGLTAKYFFQDIIGISEEINNAKGIAYKYSQVDSNILLIGETGTGKELFAQSIHNASNRKSEPFVAVNCAAFNESLLESELFGYVEGSFSGALKGGKRGLFELAHKGTIFLDEIGELPFSLQAKLLRVLQEKEVRRIGDDKVIPIDVRVICATNSNLNSKVKSNEFRQDLLYRLDVLNLKVPPLRDRKGDVDQIAKKFMQRYCEKFNKTTIKTLEREAVKAMERYNWPGNIRELRNICERLVVLTEDKTISEKDVKRILGLDAKSEQTHEINNIDSDRMTNGTSETIDNTEIDTLLKLMDTLKLNKNEAAKILGISRTTLWRKMKNQ